MVARVEDDVIEDADPHGFARGAQALGGFDIFLARLPFCSGVPFNFPRRHDFGRKRALSPGCKRLDLRPCRSHYLHNLRRRLVAGRCDDKRADTSGPQPLLGGRMITKIPVTREQINVRTISQAVEHPHIRGAAWNKIGNGDNRNTPIKQPLQNGFAGDRFVQDKPERFRRLVD